MYHSHEVKAVMCVISMKVIYLRQKQLPGSVLQNPATLSKQVSSSKL